MVTGRADAGHRPPSAMALREFPVSGYVAVVLASETEIREEWAGMRNCALDYAHRCAGGAYRLVSMRDRETGERAATIVLKRERGRYVVLDVRRLFDRPAAPELWSAAQRAAAVCNAAGTAARRRERCGRSASKPGSSCSDMPTVAQGALDLAFV